MAVIEPSSTHYVSDQLLLLNGIVLLLGDVLRMHYKEGFANSTFVPLVSTLMDLCRWWLEGLQRIFQTHGLPHA